MTNTWTVKLVGSARKNSKRLSEDIGEIFQYLLAEIKIDGPYRARWPNYGPLRGSKDCLHCHIQKGSPTYVAVWRVVDKKKKIVEMVYVGTHEKADYGRLC